MEFWHSLCHKKTKCQVQRLCKKVLHSISIVTFPKQHMELNFFTSYLKNFLRIWTPSSCTLMAVNPEHINLSMLKLATIPLHSYFHIDHHGLAMIIFFQGNVRECNVAWYDLPFRSKGLQMARYDSYTIFSLTIEEEVGVTHRVRHLYYGS